MTAAVALGDDLAVMPVQPSAVSAIWPHILPLVEAARAAVPEMVAARELAEDILRKAEEGLYQVWLVYDGSRLAAVAISSVEQFARIKACVVQYLAGDGIETWLSDWVAAIRDWARSIGCEQIECRGRVGWGPRLKPFGAELVGAAYAMRID